MNHFISLKEAKALIGRYKLERNEVLKEEYAAQNVMILSERFDRDAFDTLLAQEGCEGLRFYFGMLSTLQITLVVVAVDKDGNDILALRSGEPDEETIYSDIVEKGIPCPPNCPPTGSF